MINIETLNKTYIEFNNVGEFERILSVFKNLGFSYKNGTTEDAIEKVNTSVVNKVICHDDFIVTSRDKVTTISYKVFMKLSNSLTGEKALLNNNNKNTLMSNQSGDPRAMLNELRAGKLFKDEKYIEGLADTVDETLTLADNFIATLDKAEEKANKVCELANAFTNAIAVKDVAEITRLGKLIKEAKKYITKTNKVLVAIQDTGSTIIESETKEDSKNGAEFIGE